MTTMIKQLARNFSKRNSNFMSSNNTHNTTTYMEAMYNSWLRDPSSVHKSWDNYFRNWPSSNEDESEVVPPPPTNKNRRPVYEGRTSSEKTIDDHAAVYDLIKKYQTKGYSVARLDPLETNITNYPAKDLHDELSFLPHDWDREFRLPATVFVGTRDRKMVFKELVRRLEKIYCRRTGIDYMFMDSVEQRNWIRDQIENQNDAQQLSPDDRRKMLCCLTRAVGFEKFLCNNFPEHRKASLAGCETLIPVIKRLIDASSLKGTKSFVLGLPQRGRLNILANICKKSLKEILALFNDADSDISDDLGNFKYTLGTVVDRVNWTTSKEIRLSVVANPMNTEAFVPVVLGKSRAEQFQHGDQAGCETMTILVHDDAALYEQGIAYETMQLSNSINYTTHGVIHVVMNTFVSQYPAIQNNVYSNTSNISMSQYCRNLSRALDAPAFHINADDPEAAIKIASIAAEWRSHFHKDVIIQLVGYRRPEEQCEAFANPTNCYKIQQHTPCLEKYASKLIGENIVSENDAKNEITSFEEVLKTSCELAKLMPFDESLWRDTICSKANTMPKIRFTGVKIDTLNEIGKSFLTPPKNDPNFVLSKELHRILLERQDMLDKGIADWTLAEVLAFGSLMSQGVHVRLSVQTSECDAFTPRHHLLHHQLIPDKTFNALDNLYTKQAPYTLSYNSISENAVLGFEHGFSMANPNALVVWEAPVQSISAAQSIIDQYIAIGESKWGHQTSLVMLFPYGLECMGQYNPSAARLERFLQMCSDDPCNSQQNDMDIQMQDINWIVANCTTPANYFHILRRQVALQNRKPLIIMVSKLLVENGGVKSSVSDMSKHSEFQPIIAEEIPEECHPANYKRLIFCSGSIYYDLFKARAEKKLEDEIAIVRVEQIAPFPYELLKYQIDCYENADITWVQGEHKNEGAWSYVQPRFQSLITDTRDISYIGRSHKGPCPNVSKSEYSRQFQEIIEESMTTLENFPSYW